MYVYIYMYIYIYIYIIYIYTWMYSWGDLGFVIENVMLSSEVDRERFEEMLGVADGEI